MSFKTRIYTIVGLLVAVAIIIGLVALWAMSNIHDAMQVESRLAMNVSLIKEIKSDMQDVLVGVREIVLSDDMEYMRSEKAVLDNMVADVDRQLDVFRPLPANQARFEELKKLWIKHKGIVGRIYEQTIANTDFFAAKLTTGDSMRYWFSYEEPLRKVASAAHATGTPEGMELTIVAHEALEALKGLQLQEKLAVMAPDAESRKGYGDEGRKELARYSRLLDTIEKMTTNPDMPESEIAAFNARFSEDIKGKVTFRDDGTITSRVTRFTLPPNFMNSKLGAASRAYWDEIKPLRGGGTEIFNKVYEIADIDSNGLAFTILMEECNPTRIAESAILAQIVESSETALNEAVDNANRDYQQAWYMLSIAAVVGILAGVGLSIISVTRINGALDRAIKELTRGSDDVNRIAGQLATGSEALAEGANEQAASLEETSSALEEMASMTRQNADNANQTRQTAEHSLELISQGSNTVKSVTQAMAEISESSEKISNIIKTIEEIAFQTNLLALNAAVEAARAGEAGKGFAVVADEVRNLAGRSAQAAKDTSELIVGTVDRVRAGSENVKELADAFVDIESESQNVGRLVKEITAATNEQAQGVDQVNTAVAQMDKVTQTNAATAEQSASAAAELSDQSTTLNNLVGDLAGLVYGGRSGGNKRIAAGNGNGKDKRQAASGHARALPGPEVKVMRPNDVVVGDDFF